MKTNSAQLRLEQRSSAFISYLVCLRESQLVINIQFVSYLEFDILNLDFHIVTGL